MPGSRRARSARASSKPSCARQADVEDEEVGRRRRAASSVVERGAVLGDDHLVALRAPRKSTSISRMSVSSSTTAMRAMVYPLAGSLGLRQLKQIPRLLTTG